MTQIPAIQAPQYQITAQPSYNAVKIDIHNPQVNAPGYAQNPVKNSCCKEDPVYSYPQKPIYEVPKTSVYEPNKEKTVTPPQSVQEVPTVPPPVIVAPANQKTEIKVPVTEVKPETTAPSTVETKTTTETTAAPKTVEVKTPETKESKVDINEFINKLASPDYEIQANAMEAIAELAQVSPIQATELLDSKVVDTLLGIMNKDSSALEGPTAQQLEIREKIIAGKTVTDAEKAEAVKITPMELAERNKQYAIYTVAILEKLYGSEIEKTNKTVVPMTELPGAAGIVEQIKNNPNPMIRAAGVEALSFIQKPEYKQDLTTLFTIAQKDKDPSVQQAATKALDKLAKLTAPQQNAEPAPKA